VEVLEILNLIDPSGNFLADGNDNFRRQSSHEHFAPVQLLGT